jgi:hypothetical protein
MEMATEVRRNQRAQDVRRNTRAAGDNLDPMGKPEPWCEIDPEDALGRIWKLPVSQLPGVLGAEEQIMGEGEN